MAIVKVGTYRNPPEDITDYEAIVAHLEAYTRQIGNQGMILTEWTNTTTAPKIAMGSYISHGGVLYVVEDEDYAIPEPVADGTYYLMVEASGDTLLLSWVNSVDGYSWNAIYNGLYDSGEHQVLPYTLIKTGTSLEKWKITNLMQGGGFSRVDYSGRFVIGTSLGVSGAITAGSLSVGGIILDKNGNEVLAMNIETKRNTGTFVGVAGSSQAFSVSLTFSNAIKGIVYTAEMISPSATTYPQMSISLSSYTIAGSTITLFYSVAGGNVGTTYYWSCICSCATS